jgi:hypothetical protein
MTFKLLHGLINLGGILTETYYRTSLATSSAKEELGLDPDGEYNSSIGIASINEYVTLSTGSLENGDLSVLNLAGFDQSFQVISVHSSDENTDKFTMLVTSANDDPLYKYTVSKNLAFYPITNIFVPANSKIKFAATTDIQNITVVLRPCMVLTDELAVIPN